METVHDLTRHEGKEMKEKEDTERKRKSKEQRVNDKERKNVAKTEEKMQLRRSTHKNGEKREIR
jgi:hypothetical protein